MSESTRFLEEGYCIAPLHADSTSIALVEVAVEFASASDPKHKILLMDISVNLQPLSCK